MKIEAWRPVVGHEADYEVSDLGRVRSLDRVKSYRRLDARGPIMRTHRGKILSPGTLKSGHQFVELGRGNGFCVHVLVLEAFIGPAPDGMECCHYDDDPAHNHLTNLRWDTRAANMADFKRNYGRHQGQRGVSHENF